MSVSRAYRLSNRPLAAAVKAACCSGLSQSMSPSVYVRPGGRPRLRFLTITYTLNAPGRAVNKFIRFSRNSLDAIG